MHEVQPTTNQSRQVRQLEEVFSPRIREISDRMKVIRFGIVQEAVQSPWKRLAGMFHIGRPVNIEEMLDARGFDESADYV